MEHKIVVISELEIGTPKSFNIDGHNVLAIRTEQGCFCVEDLCPHQRRSMLGSTVSGKTMTCRYHGIQMDIETGGILMNMGYQNLHELKTFKAREQDGELWVNLD